MYSAMVRQMLYVQWRWNRDLLAFFVVGCFAVPLIFFALATPAIDIMSAGHAAGIGASALAVLAGGVIAAQGYGMDERGGHIYALSLPVTRARFLGARALTAFALLTLPALAIWIGGALTVAQLELPPTLRSYAGSLAIRALLAAWLVHSAVFALRYSAGRRAKYVLAALILVFLLLAASSALFPGSRETIERLADYITTHPGPLGVLFGRWTLIDV